jgi:uncharacterized protein
MELLARACSQSDSYGCVQLGNALYDETEKSGGSDFHRAFDTYRKGCELGSMDACCSQGWMLRNGQGAARDVRRARELFRAACDRKAYAGCSALGYDLIDSASTRAEQEEGASHLKLACENDDAFGCFSLGSMTLTQAGPAGVKPGLALLKRACALGSQDACSYANTVERRLESGLPALGDDEETTDEP